MFKQKEYLDWKKWEPNSFGQITRKESKQFSLELRSLKLNPPMRILEIGFGNGRFLTWARLQGFDIEGIEQNPLLVESAQKKGFLASLSSENQDYGKEKFDLIAAWDVLEHLTHDEIEICLKHVRTALVPGGYFVAKFPNADSPLGLAHQNGDITHRTAIGYHKWIYFTQQSQMKIVCIRGTKKVIWYRNPVVTAFKSLNWFYRKIAQWLYSKLFLTHYKTDYFSADTLTIIKKD